VSITGDTLESVDDKVIGILRDLTPDNSFVSLIVDETILEVSQ
jgi:hypothetical protein